MISIIIPAYNEEKYIDILLKSLAKQGCAKDLEIIVADAKSKDNTRQVAESFRNFFYDLKVVDGGMPAVGRNNGAKVSSGDLLFFVDADLFIPDNDFISDVAGYFRKNGLGISTLYLSPLNGIVLDKIFMYFYNFILWASQYFRAMGAMCIIADRTVFEKSGGYPEDVIMNEDHDFMLNASKFGKYAVAPFHIYFSTRRYEKEGRLTLVLKYLKATYHNLVFGPIKKPIFEYEFGDYDDKNIWKNQK